MENETVSKNFIEQFIDEDLAEGKYQNLGIDYKLKGVEPMDPNKIPEKKQVILNGIKDRRNGEPHDLLS